jgi:hypothetical protein
VPEMSFYKISLFFEKVALQRGKRKKDFIKKIFDEGFFK